MKTTFIQDQDLSASNISHCSGPYCRISDEDLSASQQDALMQCSYRMCRISDEELSVSNYPVPCGAGACRISDEDLSASLPLPVPCNCRIDA